MRSVFAISLVVFIATIAGAYSISWYSQAQATRRAIEQVIGRINEKQKYITYDAIETSGFPYDVNVSVVKPHFNGRMDLLLKEMQNAAAPAAPVDANNPPIPEWTEDALLDGKITFGVNALSDHYTMALSGNWRENAILGGQTLSSIHQQASDFSCSLQLQRSSGIFDLLWNYDAFNRDAATIAKDFRSLDCNSLGQTSIDANSKAVLSASGPVWLYATRTPQNTSQQIRFYLKVTDMQVTTQGDALMANYLKVLSPDYPFPMNFSTYGKQNIDIDFSYNGPLDFETNKNPPLEIALNKFDLTNQVYNTHIVLHLTNTPAAGERSSGLSFRVESAFSEQYDQMVQNVVHAFVRQIYASKDPKLKDTQVLLQKYTPDQLYAIMVPVIPNLHSFGKIVISLDGSYKGSADFTAGDFNMAGFEASAAPYGITGKGAAKLAANTSPSVNMAIACNNCLKIVDDVADYAGRMQKMVSYVDPVKAASMEIDPARTEATKQFLTALASQGNPASVLSYTIMGSGLNMTVNNKPLGDVIALYNNYVHPAPQPAAPAPNNNKTSNNKTPHSAH